MSNYHPTLQKQHEAILETLQLAEENWKKGHLGACLLLMEKLTYQLKDHHASECELLFDKVKARHQMREGGPFCSYFFSFFMSNRPQEKVEKRMSEILGRKFSIAIPENLKAYFSENSLFCIPLEEHLAIQALSQGLTEALGHQAPQHFSWIEGSLSLLKDLIRSNFQKEETCLWVAIHQINDPKLHADLAPKSSLDADDNAVVSALCADPNRKR